MLTHPTLDQLRALKLDGMAQACRTRSTSSASSAQNSVQKNSPFAERQASTWPSFTGSSLRQNAQHVRASE